MMIELVDANGEVFMTLRNSCVDELMEDFWNNSLKLQKKLS